MPFAAMWMQLEIGILTKVSQKEKDKHHMISLTCRIQNMTHMNLFMKQKQTHRPQRTDLWLPRGREDWEFGISRYKLLHIGWINNRVLLYNTGNYIQYPIINQNGKEYEKECI